MRCAKSRDVLRLTGLTSDQLREWTVRRGLIQADFPAQKRGSEAKFSWQTVLLLRLAVVLRTRFHVDLQANRDLLAYARELLDGKSFLSLWGFTLAVLDQQRCELLGPGDAVPVDDDVMLLRLDSHLRVLSEGFGMMDPAAQLPLFPVIGIQPVSRNLNRVATKGRSS